VSEVCFVIRGEYSDFPVVTRAVHWL